MALKGRNLFAQNGCYVCHSGYSRPQDVREALYFLYPKVSQPGDFYGSDQSPNILGTERTGPDLSQESGWHPDDWQSAHFWDPRFVDPRSLMPDMKSLFSNQQVNQVISFVEQRSGKSGPAPLRRPALREARRSRKPGLPAAVPRVQRRAARRSLEPDEEGLDPPKTSSRRRPTSPRSSAGYWLAGNPLPVTEQNLLRGKEVFLDRCIGCHGLNGDGKGPAAPFLSPTPADFTDKDDACCGGTQGLATSTTGSCAAGLARRWRTSATASRSTTSGSVVLFVKTIPNGTLALPHPVPEPKDYIIWQPSPELLAWTNTRQKLANNVQFDKKQANDPFIKEARPCSQGSRRATTWC